MASERIGPYRLLARLGTGGMGEVFLAQLEREEGFEKRLALKRILPGLSGQERFRELFAAEARLSAGLSHPHIVQVTDFGRHADDFYLVMEFVDGCDLAALLAAGRDVPPDFALAVGLACLRALAYAHSRKPPVIHGDVSPSNLLVGRQGEVKLTDFGLSRLVNRPAGLVAGKPACMAPEVALGQPACEASDQFGVGAVLYELVCGRPLYPPQAEPAAAIELARRCRIETVSEIRPQAHPALAAIIERSLQPQMEKRFGALADMEDALDRIRAAADQDTGPRTVERFVADVLGDERTSDTGGAVRTLVAAEPAAGRPPAGRRAWVPLGAAALAAALFAIVWWYLPSSKPAPALPADELTQIPEARPAEEPAPVPDAGGIARGQDRAYEVDRATDRRRPMARAPGPGPDSGEQERTEQIPTPSAVGITADGELSWSFDGRSERTGPILLYGIAPGTHVLRLRTKTALDATLRLEVPSGPGPVALAVHTEPFAILRIDGRPRGTTPIGGLSLASGSHWITLTATDHPAEIRLGISVP